MYVTQNFALTTASILYRIPDYQMILQEFVWQDEDCFPQFPKLKKFLNFWEANLDGPLYRVDVCHARLKSAMAFRNAAGTYLL
jgi:uncharacterized protein Usg